jgi:hypothetical protein
MGRNNWKRAPGEMNLRMVCKQRPYKWYNKVMTAHVIAGDAPGSPRNRAGKDQRVTKEGGRREADTSTPHHIIRRNTSMWTSHMTHMTRRISPCGQLTWHDMMENSSLVMRRIHPWRPLTWHGSVYVNNLCDTENLSMWTDHTTRRIHL